MKDKFTRKWIIENSIPIVQSYDNNLTLRALHYRLVAIGMTNTVQHYKRVVTAMIQARWAGQLYFDNFVDHDRETIGTTRASETNVVNKIAEAKNQIELWMKSYSKNRWENQPIYPEVFIEKKALIGAFESVCANNRIALNPCKGYPSLTFLYDAKERFENQYYNDKELIILYFGDYDPSGEDIPRSIQEKLSMMGVNVEVRRIALMEDQVIKWKLPPAPTKITDSRSAKWSGLGQVELDAVEPKKLEKLCQAAIDSVFDFSLYEELQEKEAEETETYQIELKEHVRNL